MPPTITPAGMSAERQHYLYEKIRPFCSSEEAAALTCPRPASQPVERTTQLPESKISPLENAVTAINQAILKQSEERYPALNF